MFRAVRKKRNEISADAAKSLLQKERRGVLAVNGEDGYPYAVPVNYLYDEESGKIYFHGSMTGYKAEALERSDKICFTVYGNVQVKDEAWAPYVQSAVVFGRCRRIDDRAAVLRAVRKFAAKYYPSAALIDEEISRSGNAVQIYEITVEHITGKEVQER